MQQSISLTGIWTHVAKKDASCQIRQDPLRTRSHVGDLGAS
jgi:hypothetical protein